MSKEEDNIIEIFEFVVFVFSVYHLSDFYKELQLIISRAWYYFLDEESGEIP